MDLNLEGKVALVTGGSKGIGKGIAESLAQEGTHLAICSRHKKELENTADMLREYGVEVLPVETDLTVEEDIEILVKSTIQKFDTIDILVNNAGTVGNPGTLDEVSIQEWRNVFQLNLFSVVSLTKKVVPYMRKQEWGRIINISSENGTQPYPDMIHYSASKGALDNFSKAISKQYAKYGILVNTVSPAFIQTPLVDEMMRKAAEKQGISREEAVQEFLKKNRPHISVGRPGTIEEVGPVVAFLASDKASFVNGSDYRVDGGSVASI